MIYRIAPRTRKNRLFNKKRRIFLTVRASNSLPSSNNVSKKACFPGRKNTYSSSQHMSSSLSSASAPLVSKCMYLS
jgi:hypothetical protein